VDEREEDLDGRHDAARLQAQDPVQLVRPGHSAAAEIPCPGSKVRDAFSLAQQLFALGKRDALFVRDSEASRRRPIRSRAGGGEVHPECHDDRRTDPIHRLPPGLRAQRRPGLVFRFGNYAHRDRGLSRDLRQVCRRRRQGRLRLPQHGRYTLNGALVASAVLARKRPFEVNIGTTARGRRLRVNCPRQDNFRGLVGWYGPSNDGKRVSWLPSRLTRPSGTRTSPYCRRARGLRAFFVWA